MTTVIEEYKGWSWISRFGNAHFVTTYYYSILYSGEKIYIPRNGHRKTATAAMNKPGLIVCIAEI